MSSCTHRVEIIPSDKPIIINLNIKIDQEIRVRLDKDIEDLLTDNPDIF
ncbi:MAG: YnbE family lipoprotein [Robiginitomaculum sp.]|nr:YnbE family lipoprotein [Robiginitomaculum sp.]